MAKEKSQLTDETQLKADLVALMRAELPKFQTFRHEDKMTHGIPDISTTGFGRTIWLEVKYEHPKFGDFEHTGIQEVNMLRLAQLGMARYIVYSNVDDAQKVFIVPPRLIGDRLQWGTMSLGYNHEFVVKWVRQATTGF